MESNSKKEQLTPKCRVPWWALYIRLSREDGDRTESLSISHQRMKLIEYSNQMPEITKYELYIDDGWTGTNFERPDFQRLLHDILEQNIVGIIVKDLSRLGRDNPKASYYIHEFFPAHKVRFIAIDDQIDKNYYDLDTRSDMMIDVKNMFNGFYPRDISSKVRSTFRTKQRAGQFIGAFACYGYRKAPDNHNALLIDEPAATVVRQIFSMYLAGNGQNTIARKLNEMGIPCPSEYKKLQGLNYRNSNRLEPTSYWTYSSIRNILRNESYTGVMIQNKTFRQICKKKAVPLPRQEWIIVPDAQEAIIDPGTFRKVQNLLAQNTRQTNLKKNMHLLAGLIKCGDCGRAMCKIRRHGVTMFRCGSYQRYGKQRCSSHLITESVLLNCIQADCDSLIKTVTDLPKLIDEEIRRSSCQSEQKARDAASLRHEITRLERKKDQAYEDYCDALISRADFLKYQKRYENQILSLENQLCLLTASSDRSFSPYPDWANHLIESGRLEPLNRSLIVELVDQITVYQDRTIRIRYHFPECKMPAHSND